MTDPLYRDDPYLREAEATVAAQIETPKGVGVTLDRTVFYPTGGGQPGDTGALLWEGGEMTVATAIKGEGTTVVHLATEGATLPAPGTRVLARLDWQTRHAHMRIHTALHLLSVVVPLPVTGGQIGPAKGRLDFNMPEAPEDKAALEEALNALIAADHPVTTEWISDAELAARPEMVKTMTVKPPMGAGRVRLVRIGSGTPPVDLQPCGGTHVATTAEIGRVRLGKIEKKGKQNRRVSIALD
ncbi:MAG: alanyl-tRNA editing protein [Pseudomonadota bacterium]